MKRPMTLTGTILGTIMQAIYTCFSLFALTLVLDFTSASNGEVSVTGIVLLVIDFAFAVTTLVLNALSIATWNKSPELYRKKKGLLIATIVFNFIFILLSIIGFVTNAVHVLNVIIVLALIATNVLLLVDIGIEKKRVEKLSETGETSENDPAPVNEVEDKIEKLSQMKEQGLISQEEYEELKKSYINERLKG